MSKPVVIAFGEVLWDCQASGTTLGGAPANFANRVHNFDLPIHMVSSLGIDELGIRARSELKALGLSDAYIQNNDNYPTGTVKIELTAGKGDAEYEIITDVAYDHIKLTPDLKKLAPEVSLICFGSLIQRSEVSRNTLTELLALAPQAIKLVDINLRKNCYSKETIESSFHAADILKLNDDEVKILNTMLTADILDVEKFCEFVAKQYNLKEVLVTRGKDGVYARSRTGEIVDLPGYSVNVKDTIGAGDAFTAGFVSKYLSGASLKASCDLGNRLGALVAQTHGAMAQINLAELDRLPSRGDRPHGLQP